jgi:bacteriorhodopsin
MHDTGVQKRGLMRAGSLLTILMGCAFMAFGLGLGFLLVSATYVM